MRRALLCIALLSVTPTAQVQSPSGSDTGRITGHVVTAYAGLIADATVTLARADEPVPIRTSKSDNGGAFSFAQLPPGRYRLQASKHGYTSRQLAVGTAGSLQAIDIGPVVEIASDAQVDIQVVVRRTASIAGRIIRPDGSAAANVRVVAAVGSGKQRQQLFEIQTTSQSDGRYEIGGLPPGEYLVGAMNVAMPGRQQFDAITTSQEARNAAVAAAAVAHFSWYPGVTDDEPGAAVTLLEGVNAEGIDIWLTPSQRFTVSGRVSWPVGVAIEGISIDYGDPAGTRSGVWLVSDPGGLFTLGAVPPGPLTLLARAESDQGTLFGIASTEVTVDSVEDIRIVVDRPGLISGRVVYEGTVPPSGRATSVVAVQKLLRVSALYPVPQSSIDSNGRFTLSGAIGEYEFALDGLQRGLALKRVTRSGRALPMNRVSLAPGETMRDIEIVVGR